MWILLKEKILKRRKLKSVFSLIKNLLWTIYRFISNNKELVLAWQPSHHQWQVYSLMRQQLTSLHVPESHPARRDDYGHCLACMYSLRSTCTPPKRRDSWVTLTCLINLETGIHSTGHSERQTHKAGMKTINCRKHARFILLPVMAKKKKKNEVIDFSLSLLCKIWTTRGKKKNTGWKVNQTGLLPQCLYTIPTAGNAWWVDGYHLLVPGYCNCLVTHLTAFALATLQSVLNTQQSQ